MDVQAQIDGYIAGQPQPKRDEMLELHRRILGIAPGCRLWFLDGRDEAGKVISNPNVGYGSRTIHYAKGGQREFYRIGFSANATGISLYIMGVADKRYLAETYGKRIGRATITGYCIRFRSLRDLDAEVLDEVIADAMGGDEDPQILSRDATP